MLKRPNINFPGDFFILVLVAAIFFYAGRGCNNNNPGASIQESAYIDALEGRVDSIMSTIDLRSELLSKSHDTVIYISREVKNTITEYITETDTILKLQKCDELARDCEELSEQCIKNDSLHIVQQEAKDIVISTQDTVITSLKFENKTLVNNNRLLKIGAGVGLAGALLAIVFR